MSYATQQRSKTNLKLANNLGMLVDNFARMGGRMNNVQKDHVSLHEQLDVIQERIS
jgi:hypothetical protein